MPDVRFIRPDGQEIAFEAPAGVSLMRAATGFGIPEILAECGGQARCATCHVYVDAAWAARMPPPSPDEADSLGFTASERRATSRLSCQILLTDDLHGLTVHLPERQV